MLASLADAPVTGKVNTPHKTATHTRATRLERFTCRPPIPGSYLPSGRLCDLVPHNGSGRYPTVDRGKPWRAAESAAARLVFGGSTPIRAQALRQVGRPRPA